MGIKKLNSRKKAENGDFQVVGSFLYAHYPIYCFFQSNNIIFIYNIKYIYNSINFFKPCIRDSLHLE